MLGTFEGRPLDSCTCIRTDVHVVHLFPFFTLKAFVIRLNEKKPEVMKYAQLSIKCQSQELLATVKSEHASLGKQWAQLMKRQTSWRKLLDCCIVAWEKGLAVQDGLVDLEQWLSKWGPPADSQALLVQYSDVLVSSLCMTEWEGRRDGKGFFCTSCSQKCWQGFSAHF